MKQLFQWLSVPFRRAPFTTAAVAASLFSSSLPVVQAAEHRIFEMRTYTTHEGKLDDLHRRFRDHTNRIFVKHGMTLIGYWTPAEAPKSENTLVYILAYPGKEAREAAWKAFRADPEWIKAKAESERDGVLVKNVDSQFLYATGYSPIQ